MKELKKQLKQLDGKGYKGYKSLKGSYDFSTYRLYIDYVQGDPFASPSKIRVKIPNRSRPLKHEWKNTREHRIYIEDKIARKVGNAISRDKISIKGSGKSGIISIDAPGQEILERTAVIAEAEHTIICLSVGLPANGRRINGVEAEKLFFEAIPNVLNQSIFMMKENEFLEAIQLADQQSAIREQMSKNNWVSFIADDSILPRESGISDCPLQGAVPFKSPIENRVTIDVPHLDQPLTGMALKKGITLIVGGGYHGKSTLLNSIERGVYNHISGDGREYVLTDNTAVKVRAEDGRNVTNVNLSPFINHLPHGASTDQFFTENASGSTSQAANVIEAIEAGAQTILIDEDTSATNFMIRDKRMKALVAKDKEPITPFIDKIKQIHQTLNVSTILVMGGSGDYFDVADDVIMLDQYCPCNVTDQAKKITENYPFERETDEANHFDTSGRRFQSESINSQKGKKTKLQAKGLSTIVLGNQDISLDYLEQLVDPSQTRMIAEILKFIESKRLLDLNYSLVELLDIIDHQVDVQGLASFTLIPNEHPGDLARPRRFELAATLNRIRSAKVKRIK